MAKHKVAVIAGHDDDTWETTGGKGVYTNLEEDGAYEEYDSNIAISHELVERLDLYDELDVLFPQEHGRKMSLRERVDFCNDNDVDFAIFVHSNAGSRSATGACSFYYEGSEEGERYSDLYAEEMRKKNYPVWQGGKYACNPRDGWSWFYVVTKTTMPVALTENFFFSNPEELKKYLLDPEVLNEIAYIHERATVKYFGLEYKEPKVKTAVYEEGEVVMNQPLNPSIHALNKAVQSVLYRWEKEEGLSDQWRKKFERRELTESDAIALLFVGIDRGYDL